MKVIIAGGRDFADRGQMHEVMYPWTGIATEIVCGLAKGADLMGKEYANTFLIDVKEFPADWEQHGKVAGFIRNKQMAEYADALVAFWDGSSKGTKNMIDMALRLGIEVHVYRYSS